MPVRLALPWATGCPCDYVGSTSGVPQNADDPVASLNSTALGQQRTHALQQTSGRVLPTLIFGYLSVESALFTKSTAPGDAEGEYHSGSPAFRRASSYLARSSSRRSGTIRLRSETRNVGSIWRSRAAAFCAGSSRPARAWHAAAMRAALAAVGCSRSPFSAHEDASSYPPA